MGTVLITGSGGLVGSECVRHFAGFGHVVVGLDSNARKDFFGKPGDVRPNIAKLTAEVKAYRHHVLDVRDRAGVDKTVLRIKPTIIIHCAAQPSHDLAAQRPFDDFDTNATGTLNLLEAARKHAPEAPFIFLSTNKVYGDAPNELPVDEDETRFEFADSSNVAGKGINETCRVDASTHSLFGCSKLAADVLVQEYGRNFGLPTVCFRAGCLTGGAHAGVEQHGFLAYLARCIRENAAYRIYGHKGKQVRDQLHARDVAWACEEYAKAPRAGEVYNLGGGWDNSCSVIEAVKEMEVLTGKKLAVEMIDAPRKGDHVVYYSDCGKFKSHYKSWAVTRSLSSIYEELCRN